MSKNILNKSKLKKNIPKKVAIEDISLDNVTIDDLNLNEDNYDEFYNLKSLLNNVSSCQLSDAFNNLFRKSGVIKGLKSINNLKAYGRITTAITNVDDWGTGIVATDECNEGDILFVKVNGDDNMAIWGDLASTNAKNRGLGGVAIYGSVRDMDVLLYRDYPIFACNFTSNAGKPLCLGDINKNIVIDDEIIRPGDFFFGDESGVVVIPSSLFTQVINELLSVKIFELNATEQLGEGISLSDIIGLK